MAPGHMSSLSPLCRAVKVFEECLVLDKEDRVGARHNLLRTHLDMGNADRARALLERFPEDDR